MDGQAQLEAERKRLEAQLLELEQEWRRSLPDDVDVFGVPRDQNQDRALRIGSLLSSLGLVNAELAAIRNTARK